MARKRRTFRRPYDVVKKKSCNQSARTTNKIQLIVMHSTEGWNYKGTEDLKSLGSWFNTPAAQASCHIGVDAEGNSAKYVNDSEKAWHCAAYNSASLGIEHVGFTKQKFWPTAQYRKSAKYVAYWSRKHNIPIQKAKVSNGNVLTPGITRHSDLGEAGGNHGDPGKAFNIWLVMRMARWYAKHGW